MLKYTPILLLLILASCHSLRDYFSHKKKHNIIEFNQSKTERIDAQISSVNDTILQLSCNNCELCGSNCNYFFWIYENANGLNLQVVKNGYGNFKMSEPRKYTLSNSRILFDFIKQYRLDTVKSEIKTDFWCDHCGGLKIIYKVKNDTIINKYIDHGELTKGDTNHILHKYAMIVLNQIAEFKND